MKQIVFYSWQSDLENATNRGFIGDALEDAAAIIVSDSTVAIEPVIDRDTQGVPGSPDISSTIFSKITAADAFVADVSIVARHDKRPTPNPNVLIELGYALKALGPEKVILVFNRAFGKIEELPFDLRTRRVLAYDMPLEGTPRAPERKVLERQLEVAIRAALRSSNSMREPVAIPAMSAIESQAPNRVIVLRRNLARILQTLDGMKPKITSEGGTVDELMEALNKTLEPVAEFSKICEVLAVMSDPDTAIEVHRWFGNVFERYDNARGFSGSFMMSDYDYFKFLGHELFVSLIAFLLREEKWSILEAVLEELIPVPYLARRDGPGSVTWVYASQHLPSLLDEGSRRNRACLQADWLNARHTSGGLGTLMPMADFTAADYFLFLLSEIPHRDGDGPILDWRPWSAIYMRDTPLFLRNAERKKIANRILKLFQIPDLEDFKRRMIKYAPNVRLLFSNSFWTSPIDDEDIERIGTK